MRLSEAERRALFYAQFHQEDTPEQIAKLCKQKPHSVRYFLKQAQDRGLAQRRHFIDFCRLGLTPYALYFSLTAEGSKKTAEIVDSIVASPRVSWLGELGGDYQFALCFNAQHVEDVVYFFDQLSLQHGQIFAEKALAARLSLEFFGNKYLAPSIQQRQVLGYHATSVREDLDELDRGILAVLGNNAASSQRQIADTLKTPASTIDYRVRKLRERKILCEPYLQINPHMLGMQSFLLLVATKGTNPALRQTLSEFCKNHTNVVILIKCLGSWDFEVAVDVANARDIIGVTHEIRESVGDAVESIRVLPLFRYLKVSEFPFVDAS